MPEELKKSLGFFSVFALILTSMIGTSLFYGVAAGARLAGPASILSWVFLGVITLYVGACFAELISMYPTSGGVYEFTKQAFGRFPSFLVGWVTWLVANIGAAVLVVAALDFVLPGSGVVSTFGVMISKSVVRFFAAICILLIFNFITYRGIEASGTLLLVFAVIMLALLVALLVAGFGLFRVENYSPFTLKPLLILAATFFLVESFFGWESASFLAEETKDPERTIPKALMWATVVVVLLGVALAAIVLGAIPAAQLGADDNPIRTMAATVLPFAVPVVILGVFLTFVGGVVGSIISSPRLLFALARDRLFIEQCTKLHPEYKTPVNAIVFQTVVAVFVVMIAFGDYTALLSMLVPLALLMYAIVLLTIPILRKKKPNHARPFRVWFGESGPIVVALVYLGIVFAWVVTTPSAASTLLIIAGLLLLSVPIYLFLTMVYNPDAIIAVNDYAARVNYWLEDFLFPKAIREQILAQFKGHFKGKEVLEFGSGVGTFTMHLADEVGPTGKVVAVDFSRSNVDIVVDRARKKGVMHLVVIHDEHQVNRVHPDIRHADIIYSIGFLGYVQDLRKVLKEMHAVLSPHGKICFVEYTNFFKILPDPALVSDIEALERAFRDAGFAVHVQKKKGVLWNYLIISGIKTDSAVPFI